MVATAISLSSRVRRYNWGDYRKTWEYFEADKVHVQIE
jgi:hypothetical protein